MFSLYILDFLFHFPLQLSISQNVASFSSSYPIFFIKNIELWPDYPQFQKIMPLSFFSISSMLSHSSSNNGSLVLTASNSQHRFNRPSFSSVPAVDRRWQQLSSVACLGSVPGSESTFRLQHSEFTFLSHPAQIAMLLLSALSLHLFFSVPIINFYTLQ